MHLLGSQAASGSATGGAAFADDIDHRGAIFFIVNSRIKQTHRKALGGVMPVTAGGDKTDPFVVLPDWLIPGRIRVVGIDLKGDQLLRKRSPPDRSLDAAS